LTGLLTNAGYDLIGVLLAYVSYFGSIHAGHIAPALQVIISVFSGNTRKSHYSEG
jgi:hypothetical protein